MRKFLLAVSLGLCTASIACAHKPPSAAAQFASRIRAAREEVRQDARIARLEALVTALEARLQAVQAQARAQGELGRPGRQLSYERWQPAALERLTTPDDPAITGHGQDLRISTKAPQRSRP